jgi:acyl-CoA thioester hydrolase
MEEHHAVDDLLAGYPVVITLPVQWGDMDAFAHVNNVVYFRWFESARIAYFERIGVLKHLSGADLGPILASSSCEYRRPLVFPDTVWVGIRATRIGRTSIALEHRIVSERQKSLAAEGIAMTVFYDYASARPHPVPDDVRRVIEELEGWAR